MANLLPTEEKKQINKEYRLRIVVVYIFSIAGILLIAITLLVPAYVLSLERGKNVSDRLATAKENAKSLEEGRDPVEIAEEIKGRVSLLSVAEPQKISPRELFDLVTFHKPKTLSVESLLYSSDSQEVRVTIDGISPDRKTLDSFVKSLRTEERFSSVDLPISDLVSVIDISFSIQVIIRQGNDK
ncbi:MAG: hypothetical protein COZ49_03840 [Candidatus Yonathbacteria bacterium CG_4_10_14_3_um_filter_47_65]|uniref:Uncharacterized protein n=1 Tax=Candidatus Yonathbacteria bacterium CG_4_9_14_0_8_um_filter_46_47 TaxID=1975106 RepID=A0A2M8D7I1_9BACT|nr:MAG: hypothetical protein COX54_03385 [Candidatus Yonathbacteria bacterium CG23_combo_of_CG06-09_8_20_14_all_46_18]PIQ33270.1 MAG: hypothetical protein COW61_00025 [Candidatus Yonathbacteria bacterium CG17_big_fil_post_rev_8_21_14_2_50_46_19]PIX56107.1 MAG: hypothetical protein COZ49_03840 [Candidatus Yonathbacteria bacterium CG_4_10_14_3_um_filter_47_65]PIY57543.1 MAG: hypothetical protein COY99_02625 [Candidatus Yonathbacteria bacterium CG_4_10_14_0_8_um_filter_47_645]PJB83087.1 MAG: hypot